MKAFIDLGDSRGVVGLFDPSTMTLRAQAEFDTGCVPNPLIFQASSDVQQHLTLTMPQWFSLYPNKEISHRKAMELVRFFSFGYTPNTWKEVTTDRGKAHVPVLCGYKLLWILQHSAEGQKPHLPPGWTWWEVNTFNMPFSNATSHLWNKLAIPVYNYKFENQSTVRISGHIIMLMMLTSLATQFPNIHEICFAANDQYNPQDLSNLHGMFQVAFYRSMVHVNPKAVAKGMATESPLPRVTFIAEGVAQAAFAQARFLAQCQLQQRQPQQRQPHRRAFLLEVGHATTQAGLISNQCMYASGFGIIGYNRLQKAFEAGLIMTDKDQEIYSPSDILPSSALYQFMEVMEHSTDFFVIRDTFNMILASFEDDTDIADIVSDVMDGVRAYEPTFQFYGAQKTDFVIDLRPLICCILELALGAAQMHRVQAGLAPGPPIATVYTAGGTMRAGGARNLLVQGFLEVAKCFPALYDHSIKALNISPKAAIVAGMALQTSVPPGAPLRICPALGGDETVHALANNTNGLCPVGLWVLSYQGEYQRLEIGEVDIQLPPVGANLLTPMALILETTGNDHRMHNDTYVRNHAPLGKGTEMGELSYRVIMVDCEEDQTILLNQRLIDQPLTARLTYDGFDETAQWVRLRLSFAHSSGRDIDLSHSTNDYQDICYDHYAHFTRLLNMVRDANQHHEFLNRIGAYIEQTTQEDITDPMVDPLKPLQDLVRNIVDYITSISRTSEGCEIVNQTWGSLELGADVPREVGSLARSAYAVIDKVIAPYVCSAEHQLIESLRSQSNDPQTILENCIRIYDRLME